MVKAFHAAGLEVILDVVYNHTAEAGPLGPTLSFRGLDDLGYYQRVQPPEPEAGEEPVRTPTGTSPGAATPSTPTHTQSLRMILDSLRYWVSEMHVDGFRFDLMSAITRTHQVVDMGSHLLTAIGQDPVLRHVKLVAEPWDASMDGYRVGQFPPPWVEWNDQFRDTVRDFWRGHSSGVRTVATRLAGSSDLYADDGRSLTPRSTSSPRTTASRCATWCPTTRSTTRRTARTAATAPTTTGRGTAASRARPTTRRSSRCVVGRRPT